MNLQAYGFSGYFEALSAAYPDLVPARVLSQEKGIYRVVSAHGEKSAAVSGKFRFEAETASDFPAVGDFVLTGHWENDSSAVIHQVLNRKSVFTRRAAGTAKQEQVVAANIDTLFLCMSLNHDFNLRRLERYLSIAWDSGAKPVIVLTKSDLCSDLPDKLREVESVAFGVDTVVTSSLHEDGLAQMMPYLSSGKTAGFLGSSGVGKSTLINRLLGSDTLATNGLRNDDKGRHTTTRRELILLQNGALVLDTPGMRELGMWDTEIGIDAAFADIESLSRSCRFRNCTHESESGCAVRAAIESGELSAGRYLSYQKLRAENSYAEDSESYLAAREKKFKAIAKYNKTNKKR